jgi:hypothetical protein
MKIPVLIIVFLVLIGAAFLLYKEDDRSLVLEENITECQVDPTLITFENPSGKYLSPAEIGEELASKWLNGYKNPLCGTRGIKGFTIKEVEFAGESGNDLAVNVTFDVEPNDPSLWATGTSTIENGIIRDKVAQMMVYRTGQTFYKISRVEIKE